MLNDQPYDDRDRDLATACTDCGWTVCVCVPTCPACGLETCSPACPANDVSGEEAA